MQNHINSKDAQVTLVKGVVVTDLTDSNSIQIGDVINAGTAIFFSEGSEIVLTFDDGSQQRVYSTSNEVDSEASVEIIPPGDKFVVNDGDATSDVQNEISAIQKLIDSGEDIEGPETAAGLTGNEGTSFVALNRVGDETLAQAGYDTSEQEGIVTNNNDRENLDNAAFRPVLTDAAETVTIDEDTTATGNVLDNASSPDGPLSVTSFTIDGVTYAIGETASLPSGDFTLNADGSYSFIPAANYNGDVPAISYTVQDGLGNTATSTLTIAITPVSDVVDSNESITIDEDTTATGNVLDNASSPDGPLSVTSFTIDGVTYAIGETASLASGDFTLNADGSYSFIPAANYNGDVPVVTYTVLDGAGDTVVSTLTIDITAVSDIVDSNESITIDEDTTATGNVLDNASSPDGPLSVTSFTIDGVTYAIGETASLASGDFTLNADGSYSFIPAANYTGDVPVVTYTVLDGAGDTVVSTLTIDITAVSDIVDSNESITIDEDTTATGNVLDNASSPDGPLSVTSFTIDGVTYAIGETASLASGDFTLNADGSYSFIPAANYNGDVPVVTYTVLDGAGDTVVSTLTIDITAVSDIVDSNESITIDEDTTATGNVLDNASSPDGPLSVTSFIIGGVTYAIGETASLASGDFTLNADGSYSFIPAANYNGDVPVVTYTVLDGAGDTVVSTLTIDITAVSDVVDSNESITIDEDTTAMGNVLDNASSPDGPLSVTSFTIGGVTYAIGETASLASGDFTLNADGSYSFIPAENYNGDVPVVTYTVLDGAGDTVVSTLTIDITAVSDIVDSNESITIDEDTTATGNVLDNASSPDGPLSVTSFIIGGVTYAIGETASLASGEFTLNADGSYSFIPAANYNGDVPVVTYTVLDGAGDTVVSTLTIDITAVSDIVDSNESITIDEDTTATGNVLDNASSPDGPLSVTSFTIGGVTYAIGETASLPSGDFTLNADGSYSFIPAANYNGDVPVVTYTVLDGAGDTVVSTLTIDIAAVSDIVDSNESITIDEDTTATGNVLDNASSPDGPLSVTSFTIDGVTYAIGETASLASGDFTLNADGSYSFIPAANYNGDVPVVTYTVLDGAGDTVVSTLTIAITPDDDVTATLADTGVTQEDTTLNVSAADGVLSNDSDIDNDLTVATFTVDTGDGTQTSFNAGDTATIDGVGTITLNADGSYTFVPAANYNGDVPVVTYTTNTGSSDTLTLTIVPDNDPTVTLADTGETQEDTTLNVSAADGVLSNDSDADIALMVATFTVDTGTGGQTSFNAGDTADIPGVGSITLNADGSYTFVPVANYDGDVPVVTYTTNTGSSDTLSIEITPVDDASNTTADTGVTEEDTTLIVSAADGVLSNDSDIDNDITVATFTVDTGDGTQTSFNAGDTATIDGVGTITLNADGSYTFVPVANYDGDVPVVTYTTNTGSSDTLSIEITPVDDASNTTADTGVTEEDTTLNVSAADGVLSNDSDIDNDLTVATFTVDTGDGTQTSFNAGDTATIDGVGTITLNADGSYTFVPVANYDGDVPVVTYTTNTGSSDTLSIEITPVDDASNTTADTGVTEEDTTLIVSAADGVLSNDSDIDNDLTVATFTVDTGTGAQTSFNAGDTADIPGVGSITLNADGSYTFVPVANYNGDVPVVTYTTNTGSSDTLSIEITPVDDASNTTADTGVTEEDTTLIVSAADGVLSNDSDIDNDLTVATFTVDTGTGGQTSFNAGDTATIDGVGTITLNADGSYTFVPVANYDGDVPVVTYTTNTGSSDTLSIEITPVDDATATLADTGVTEEDTTLNVSAADGVLSNDSDIDNNLTVATFTVDTGTGGQTSFNAGDTATIDGVGTITLNADGSYTFVPVANYDGDVPVVTYTTNTGSSDTLSIEITPVDDATATLADTGVTEEDTTLNVSAADGVLSNDSDIDNNLTIATFTVDTGTGGQTSFNAGDTATIDGVGTITLNADGSYTFVPVANYDGDVPVVTYTTNTGSSDTLSIEITPVDDASNTTADTGVTEEDTTLNVSAADGVLSNDSDIDNDLTVATFTVDTGDGTQTSFNAGDTATIDGVGTITLNADGSYTFVPVANYDGDVPVVTYTTNTGSSDTLSIEITPVDDASNTTADTGVTEEDTTLNVSAADGVLSNDSDIDNDLTVATFTVDTGTGAQTSFNAGDTADIPGVGSITLNADGSYTFVPVANYDGDVPVVTYTTNTSSSDTLSIEITPVDDASNTTADTGVTEEDTTLIVSAADGVLSNDSDIDNDLTVATFTVDTGTGGQTSFNAGDTATIDGVGTITLNADGSYTFVPVANYDGDVPVVTYTTNTGSSDTLSIEITPVDDASNTTADTGVTEEDTTLIVSAADGVLSNDSDIDNDLTVATFTVDTGTGGQTSFNAGDTATIDGVGTITLNADGSYTFVPVANYDGDVPVVTYTTNTGSSDTLSIEITPVDDATATLADTGVTEEDTTLNVSAADGVLSNDSDIDNDITVATFTVDTGTGGQTSFNAGDTATIDGVGTITLNADGSYTFVPVANYDGDVPVVTYTTNTGSSDTLSIEITPVDDASNTTADTGVTEEDTTLIVSAADGVLSNDSDIDNDLTVATFTVDTGTGGQTSFNAGDTADIPGVGSITLNADGSYTFVPVANYDGDVPVVTYTTNTGSSDTLSIEITPVDDATATLADTGVTEEDTTLNVSAADGVLSNDSDIDNNLTVATFTVDTGTGGQTSFNAGDTATIDGVGTITLNADGSYTFVPVANYDGDVPVVTYTTNTGSSDTLSIEITPVDDATATLADTGVTEEDTTLNVSAADGVLSNDSDIDNDITVATFTVDTGTGGQTSFNAGDTATIDGVGTITLNADGSYTFVPVANYDGDVPVVTYTTNTGSSDTLSIEITPVDDASNTTADTGVTEEDTTLIVSAADGVLSNDSDIDNDLTVATFTVDTGTGGQTSFNAGDTADIPGVGSITLNADGSYTFVPVANYDGDVPVVTYTTNTGSSDTLSIEITPVDDATATLADTGVTEEDTTLNVSAADGVLSNDSDIDNNLTVATFTVDTGTGVQTSFNAGDTATIDGVGTITLNADGSYTFVPVANYDGDVPVVTYTTNTGSSDTLSISITPVDDATATLADTGVTEEDTTLIVSAADGVLSNDSDIDNDLTVATFTVDTGTGVQTSFNAGDTADIPGVGSITLNADGSYTFVPVANYDGDVPVVTYTTNTGSSDTLSISITPVDDATATLADTGVTEEDTTLIVSAADGVLSNDSDIDNDLTVATFTVDTGDGTQTSFNAGDTATIDGVGTITLNADGSYTFVPVANYDGDVPVVTYTTNTGSSDTLSIEITPVDDATATLADTGVTEEDTTLIVSAADGVLSNDSDIDNNLTVATFTVDTGTGGQTSFNAGDTATIDGVGTITLNADGSYTFVPVANYDGDVPVVTYTTNTGSSDTLSIEITPVDDASNTTADTGVTEEDTTLNVSAADGVLSNDSDIDNDLTVATFTVDTGTGVQTSFNAGDTATIDGVGTITLNADGSYTFVPVANYDGDVPVVTYTTNTGSSDTLSISITPVDDATATLADTGVTEEDTTLIVSAADGVLSNDSDIDNDLTVATFTVDTGTGVQTSFNAGDTATIDGVGTITLNADGSYTFVPVANYDGDVPVVTYTTNTGSSDTLSIEITPVDDASNTTADTGVTEEDTTLIVSAADGVLSNDSDIDNDLTVATFTVDTGTGAQTSFNAGDTATIDGVGTITLNADGSYTFVPVANYDGDVPVVTYTTNTGSSDTLSISITPVDDATATLADTGVTEEDTTLIVSAADGVLSNDSDIDNDLTVATFTVDTGTGAQTSFNAGDTATIDGVGSITLNADGSYTFVPVANYDGDVPVVTYTTNTGSSDTLSIEITPVDDASNTTADTGVTEEDTTLIVSAADGVLSNDSDIDNDLTVATFTVDTGTGGQTSFNAGDTATIDGVGTITLNADGSYTFVPVANYDGDVPVVTYTTNTGSSDTLSIEITPVNDAPVAANDNFSVNEGASVSGNVISHDDGDGITDNDGGDGSALSVTQVNGVDLVFGPDGYAVIAIKDGTLRINAQGDFTYTQNGTTPVGAPPSFTYTLSDGFDTDTATVTIDVVAVNTAPIAADDSFMIDQGESISGNIIAHHDGDSVTDYDPDGDSLTITQVNGVDLTFDPNDGGYATVSVEGGTLRINAQGDFTYENSDGYALGTAYPSFQYTLSDGTDTDTANVTIAINDTAPDAVNDNNYIFFKTKDINNDGVEDSARSRVRGNIITRASSGDRADTSPDGVINLTQIEIGGQSYIFDNINTSFDIVYEVNGVAVGVLHIESTGFYTFELYGGVDVNLIPNSIQYTYTIQDGDAVNAETDQATLTIHLVQGASTTPANSILADSELIDISYQDESNDVVIDEQYSATIPPDLSDLFASENPESLDVYLGQSEAQADDSIINEEINSTESTVASDDMVLDDAEATVVNLNADKTIINGFLIEGATLINDGSVERPPQQVDLDSNDIL